MPLKVPSKVPSSAARVIGLSAAFAAALNGTMVMPLIVLALCRVPGIDESTATAVASAEIGGIALYCLLWPRLVQRAHFRVALGGVLAMVAGQLLTQVMDSVAPLSLARLLAGVGEVLRRGGFKATDNAADDMVLEHCSRPLADKFQVSAEAMRIRLEGIGLLLRKNEPSLF